MPVTVDSGAKTSYRASSNNGWVSHALQANYCRKQWPKFEGSGFTVGRVTTQARIAIPYTPSASHDVKTLTIGMYNAGSPTDNLVVRFFTDSSGDPSTTQVGSDATYALSKVDGNATFHDVVFATPVSLSASTQYWIEFSRSGAVDSANYPAIGTGDVGSGNGDIGLYNSGSSSWSHNTSKTCAVQVHQSTPVALYLFTQDTKLHAWRSTDLGNTWSEQDSANAPTVTNANYPFDITNSRSMPQFGCGYFTAANTVTVRLFDPLTDTWASSAYGTSTPSAISNERSIVLSTDNAITQDGAAIQLHGTSSADDADLVYSRCTAPGNAWAALVSVLSVASAEASLFTDVVTDKTSPGRNTRFYYHVTNDDFMYRTLVGATQGGAGTIDSSAADVETEHSPATYRVYQNGSGVDEVLAAWIDADGTLEVRKATLEAATPTFGTQVEVSSSASYASYSLATAVINGNGYLVASTGSAIDYWVDVGNDESWGSVVNWLTSLTNAAVSNLLTIPGEGLLLAYTDNEDAKVDWLVHSATLTGSVATATGAALAGSPTARITGALAGASAAALAGTTHVKVTGSTATATTAALSGTVQTGNSEQVTGETASASAAAGSGALAVDVAGFTGASVAEALSGTTGNDIDVGGSLAASSASALDGSITNDTDVTGASAAVTVAALDGSTANDSDVTGSGASASILSMSGQVAGKAGGSSPAIATATGGAGQLRGALAGSPAAATAASSPGTTGNDIDVTGSLATAAGAAASGQSASRLTGALSTATGASLAGSPRTEITGSLAASSGLGYGGTCAAESSVTGGIAGASGSALAGLLANDLAGSTASSSGAAASGAPGVAVTGLTSIANGLALSGTTANENTVVGGLATATILALDGSITNDTDAAGGLAAASTTALDGRVACATTGSVGVVSSNAASGSAVAAVGGTAATATVAGLVGLTANDTDTTGSTSAASAVAEPGAIASDNSATGSLATASVTAFSGSTANDNSIAGAIATADGIGWGATIAIELTGESTSGSATATAGQIEAQVTGDDAPATAAALAGSADASGTAEGALASAAAAAQDGSIAAESSVPGSLASAIAAAADGAIDIAITGVIAEASTQAPAGSTQNLVAGQVAASAADGLGGTTGSDGSATGAFASAAVEAFGCFVDVAPNGHVATGGTNALHGTPIVLINGALAGGNAAGQSGTTSTPDPDVAVSGSLGQAGAEAFGGLPLVVVIGARSEAMGSATTGDLSFDLFGVTAAASGSSHDGRSLVDVSGALAAAVGQSLAGLVWSDDMGADHILDRDPDTHVLMRGAEVHTIAARGPSEHVVLSREAEDHILDRDPASHVLVRS